MSNSTKINEAFVKSIIDNCNPEEAVRLITQALTNRDTIIQKLTQEKK